MLNYQRVRIKKVISPTKKWLVAGIPTLLKNDGVRQWEG
jgi:hypothetical protein